jgi:hypothetical protein
MVRPSSLLLLLTVTVPSAFADEPPALPAADRVRIAEAFRLADTIGNKVWPGWDQAPFAVLLVTPEHEFLLRHPKPTDDFRPAGGESVGSHKVWYRKRQYPTNMLATFPAVGGVPTIVIGQAPNTQSKISSRWVITFLHEHFHQLQYSRPRYYADADALGLSRGSQDSMWMLNYPFPYTDGKVKEQFAVMSKALAAAVKARGTPEFDPAVKAYLAEKESFRKLVKPDDYRYLAFQFWQEGIARYTEYRLAVLAAAGDPPGKEFQALPDYTTYQSVAKTILENIEKELGSVQLDKLKRTVVYNFGAAEGLVLDHVNPDWRKKYHQERFDLDRFFRPGK